MSAYSILFDQHNKLIIKHAQLRNHVRELLDTPNGDEAFRRAWLVEAGRLFDRYHWWDLEGRNRLHQLNQETL
jgi:phage baseplate assembly protein W